MKGITRSRIRWQTVGFYMIYTVIVVAIIGAIAFGLVKLNGWLADYESSRSKYVRAQVVKMVEDGEFAALLEKEGEMPYSGMVDEYVAYMKKLTEGKEITTNALYIAGTSDLNYNLYADGKLIYSFTLRQSGEKNAHGFPLWEFVSIENHTILYATYRVQAPGTSTVYADGKALDESYIVETGILTGYEDHLPDEVPSPANVIYSMDTYFGKPDYRVVDSKGRDQVITEDETGLMVAAINYDNDLKEEMESNVISVAEVFARFTIFDVSAKNVLKLTVENSNAWKYVKNFDTTWAFATFGHSFSNETTENYILWTDDIFSVDVHFDFYVKYRAEERTNPIFYRMYFQKSGDSWLLYDFEIK